MTISWDLKLMQKKSVILLDIYIYIYPGRLEVEAWGPGLSESKEKFHC